MTDPDDSGPRPSLKRARHWVATRYRNATPGQLLVSWFLALVFAGTLALMLPWSHHGALTWLDALFTATSAACVTGLIVVDTGTAFTGLGQGIILVLIQLGGIGMMTFATLGFRVLGIRVPLTSQLALEDTLFQRSAAAEARQTFWAILRIMAVVELIGAVILFAALSNEASWPHRAWSAVFHAVSAFCNAGFSIYSDSLEGFQQNFLLLGVMMVLIVLGGFGHIVLAEFYELARRTVRREPLSVHKLTLHTRVVLVATAVLVLGGAFFFWAFELTRSDYTVNFVAGPLFQSVTARTAGFNTIPTGEMALSAILVTVFLMYVGAAPGSCGGGVKVTSLAVWLALIRKELLGRADVTIGKSHVPDELIRRAILLIQLALAWNMAGVFILTLTEAAPLDQVLFEQVSAFGTVGLSMGLTPELTRPGQFWIILTMFIGRVGPLTLALGLNPRRKSPIRYPEGRLMIG